ncbi:uncharacterized protein LOC144706646 [Wolffia australiana]
MAERREWGRRREERGRRFQEALRRIYFPESQIPSAAAEIEQSVEISVEAEGLEEADEEEIKRFEPEMVDRKLTRCQRKRLRKRKLKEATSAAESDERRKIAGPLLSSGRLRRERSSSVESDRPETNAD